MKENKFVLLKDVTIKAGAILDRAPNERGGDSHVECVVEMGKDGTAYFNMSLLAIEDMPKDLITRVR